MRNWEKMWRWVNDRLDAIDRHALAVKGWTDRQPRLGWAKAVRWVAEEAARKERSAVVEEFRLQQVLA